MDKSSETKECAVTFCDGTGKLVPVCSSGHFLHIECLKDLIKNQKETKCPLCRDGFLEELKQLFEINHYEAPPEEDLTPFLPSGLRYRVVPPQMDFPLIIPRRHVPHTSYDITVNHASNQPG
jgi:hypothetical protein